VQRPDFTLDVGDVNFWAEQLMDDERPAEAIALLKWSIQVHADSSASWTALGVAHRMMGESALAEAAFAKSVELDPGNFVARRQLVELRKQW
jgi:cytochrome c-type biogenesis protein CcmH/NrfG